MPNTPKVAEAEDATTATTTNGRGIARRRHVSSAPVRSLRRAARSLGLRATRSAPGEALVEKRSPARSRITSPLLAAGGPTHQRASASRERCSGMQENHSSNFIAIRTARASTQRSQGAQSQENRSPRRAEDTLKKKEEPSSFFGRESRVARYVLVAVRAPDHHGLGVGDLAGGDGDGLGDLSLLGDSRHVDYSCDRVRLRSTPSAIACS